MKKYELYIPQDVYDEILNEICLFNTQFEQEKVNLTIDDKVFFLYNSIVNTLNFENGILAEKLKSLYKISFGQDFDLDIAKPEVIIKVLFSKNVLPYISQFLNLYDNAFFWRAFGISIEKGNHIKNELFDINNSSILYDEILNEAVLDKRIIREIILPKIYLFASMELKEEDIYLAHLSRHIYNKFPRIAELICNEIEINATYNPDFSSMIQVALSEDIKCLEYNPKLFYDLFVNGYAYRPEALLMFIHIGLTTNNFPGFNEAARVIFSMHEYGYEVYNYYLDFCQESGLEAWSIVESPEIYFVNSYKAPQLKSLCNRYFPLDSEEESKIQTKKCFEKIFKGLQYKKYINCSLNEFLWAFGLTDKYPHGFKKIAFHTSREKKANGAFLTLLKILGYEEDQIKEMRMERKNKPNLINQIFDLTLSRKTKESKDYHDLLEIVKSSGLPVNG